MKPAIFVDLDFGKLQGIRLVHAVAEADIHVCIAESELPKFALLKEIFGLVLVPRNVFAISLSDIGFCHNEPRSFIGLISRPLIYPRAIFSFCKAKWRNSRDIAVSFSGLLTPQRLQTISEWLRSHGGQPDSTDCIFMPFDAASAYECTLPLGHVQLCASTRGRLFPIKTWDSAYYEMLLRSRFVLCPDGEHVWSYRFFEAIICGAIPIVETTSSLYSGYHFFTVRDSDYEWNLRTAVRNYELCREQLIVPREHLNAEIERQIFK